MARRDGKRCGGRARADRVGRWDVPVRLVGEQHVKDDLGWIPTVKDWLVNLKVEPWMGRTPFRPSRDGVDEEAKENDAGRAGPE